VLHVKLSFMTKNESIKETKNKTKEKNKLRIKSAEIEAEIAFFDARISLIGAEPKTTYARSQRELYLRLSDTFTKQLKFTQNARRKLFEKKETTE